MRMEGLEAMVETRAETVMRGNKGAGKSCLEKASEESFLERLAEV